MTNAPDRIWAHCFNTEEFGAWDKWGGYARVHNRHPLDDNERATGAEYVRADLARPMTVADAAKVMADAMDRREWEFYPIEMPYNANGDGPATVGVDATYIEYEVWEAFSLHATSSHCNLPDAISAALRAISESKAND